ncbi:Emopamil-binding protein [Glomus cerebriforme]|uniref:Emopamil-binding protein n=1 Tax=Glomus cerebriforme TaxID=658196 RepID=A0A397S8V7_9GLOM|nr:Emopamil-binding protein [Glomus cerebriforme]
MSTEDLQQIINSFITVMILFTIAYITTLIIFPLAEKKVTKFERFISIWLIWNALIHLILEGSFVILSLISTIEKSNGILAELWKEYGKADSRWLYSDPTILSVEIPTFIFCGPLALYIVYLIMINHSTRHYWQIILCVCEIYGCWITFCPEWLTGSKGLDTENLIFFGFLLFNGVWVIIPMILLYQSWKVITENDRLVKEFKLKVN